MKIKHSYSTDTLVKGNSRIEIDHIDVKISLKQAFFCQYCGKKGVGKTIKFDSIYDFSHMKYLPENMPIGWHALAEKCRYSYNYGNYEFSCGCKK